MTVPSRANITVYSPMRWPKACPIPRRMPSPRDVFTGVEQEMARLKARLGLTRMSEPQLEGPSVFLDEPLIAQLAVGGAGNAPIGVAPPCSQASRIRSHSSTAHSMAPLRAPHGPSILPKKPLSRRVTRWQQRWWLRAGAPDAHARLLPANAKAPAGSRGGTADAGSGVHIRFRYGCSTSRRPSVSKSRRC